MRRFLLAWELGGDLGHLRRQCAIARGLRDRGHEVLLAFADPTHLDPATLDGVHWVQAPTLRLPESPDPAPINASDILLNVGFADAPALAGALAAWSSLLRALRPNVVVADHAPTALLAARLEATPRVAVGSGFSIPPAGDPMPALRPGTGIDPAALAQRDARLVAAIRKASERLRGRAAAPSKAREVFEADASLVCAWPEFDCFGPRADVEYVGPQGGGADLRVVPWTGTRGPRIFAYLKPRDARFAALLDALAAVAGEAIVAAPGLTQAGATALARANVRVVAAAVDLASALAQADLCVGHSGAGLVAAAAASGVPMVLFPMQLEQALVARRAHQAGMARVVMPGDATPDLAACLREALGSAALRAAAHVVRASAARAPLDAAERIERVG